MAPADAVSFAAAARRLSAAARARGLSVPGFRCPPRLVGADRTLHRRPDGTVMIAVRVRGRPLDAVAADLVDGVVAVNGLVGAEAAGIRRRLLAAAAGSDAASAA